MDDDFEFPAAGTNEMEAADLPEVDPILKVGEETQIGSNGLKKKLLKDGDGWENPKSGDDVQGNTFFIWDVMVSLHLSCI